MIFFFEIKETYPIIQFLMLSRINFFESRNNLIFPEHTMDLEKIKEKAGPVIYILTNIFALWFFYWFASVWR